MAQAKRCQRVLGPYFHKARRCWRVIVVFGTDERETHYFAKEAEAARAKAEFEREVSAATSRTVWEAIEDHKTIALRDNKASSIYQTDWALKTFFPDEEMLLSELTPKKCQALYDDLVENRLSRTGKRFSVACHRNTLAQAKTFLRWCAHPSRKWLTENPLDGIEGRGRRNKGKVQLRISELKSWDKAALQYANEGEAGAVAALMTYYLGLRCSEIVGLKVRDVDDGATVLWVWADNPEEGKTGAAQRELRIPAFLRPYLLELVEGKRPDQFLFTSQRSEHGRYWRNWVLKWVKRICRKAGVRSISAHGMRGKRSSRAIELGVVPDLLARDMGHESTRTTLGGSYVTREAIEEAERQRRIDAVKGPNGHTQHEQETPQDDA